MKRSWILLALVVPACGSAQISTLRNELSPELRVHDVYTRLLDLITFGFADKPSGRRMSRLEYAVGVRNMAQFAEERLNSDKPFEGLEKNAWRDSFWMFKWLGKTLSSALIEIGVALNEYDARVEIIKQGLAKAGIMVDDPYARFSDVPKGYWADEAIHRMRELGIVKGYPDNTFRG
jgi:hypothetical protein